MIATAKRTPVRNRLMSRRPSASGGDELSKCSNLRARFNCKLPIHASDRASERATTSRRKAPTTIKQNAKAMIECGWVRVDEQPHEARRISARFCSRQRAQHAKMHVEQSSRRRARSDKREEDEDARAPPHGGKVSLSLFSSHCCTYCFNARRNCMHILICVKV